MRKPKSQLPTTTEQKEPIIQENEYNTRIKISTEETNKDKGTNISIRQFCSLVILKEVTYIQHSLNFIVGLYIHILKSKNVC